MCAALINSITFLIFSFCRGLIFSFCCGLIFSFCRGHSIGQLLPSPQPTANLVRKYAANPFACLIRRPPRVGLQASGVFVRACRSEGTKRVWQIDVACTVVLFRQIAQAWGMWQIDFACSFRLQAYSEGIGGAADRSSKTSLEALRGTSARKRTAYIPLWPTAHSSMFQRRNTMCHLLLWWCRRRHVSAFK